MDNKYEQVFVILTYRNTTDIVECLDSLKVYFTNYKVVIVNSYYDDESKLKLSTIAKEYSCDFLNVDNRGYSYGNNAGIQYCMENYEFDFLVVCNPDVVVKKNSIDMSVYKDEKVVIAPIIRNLNGKMQNPYWVLDNQLAEKFIYLGYKHKNKLELLLGIGCNKIIREFFNCLFMKKRSLAFNKIYAAHGSFFIISRSVVDEIFPVFDENMFLFAEEAYLARRLKDTHIDVIYTKDIEIVHKEDGSVGISNIDESGELRKSVIYYYELVNSKKNK